MKNFCAYIIISVVTAVMTTAAQPSKQPASDAATMPPLPPAAQPDTAADTTTAIDPGEAFMLRYGKGAADSLEYIIRNDYMVCTGDTVRISRDRLFRWKAYIDSVVMHGNYAERFKSFVAATGMKAHEVRPCEPIAFYDQLEKQINEMDSLISAQRAAKEKAHKDSLAAEKELKSLRSSPADILNIPAGMSRASVRAILSRNNIRSTNAPRHLQVDQVRFEGLVVTIAFHFNEDDKYTGYEVETEALAANKVDDTVREWVNQLTKSFESRIGPPSAQNRVNFRDIRQGRLSIVSRWERGENRPQTLIGLATHNNLYYAKAMVQY